MNTIDQELIDAIPEAVDPTREGCQSAVDAALNVLFEIGVQFQKFLTFPPIFSLSGDEPVELWPMPPPYHMNIEESRRVVENNLNELLRHTKINAEAFNESVLSNNLPEARNIADITPKDSGQIWHDANGLARILQAEAEEDPMAVYQVLDLSEATTEAYIKTVIPGWEPVPEEPVEPLAAPETATTAEEL